VELQRPRVLIVGDYEHHEFTFACNWLKQHTELSAAESVAQTLNKFPTRQRDWHVVVFAQGRPGQIKDREVEQLAQQCPLASLVALLGSWCEGETRSGNPWPGVFRVYWHQFPAQCQQQLILGDSTTSWQLPRTASAVERFKPRGCPAHAVTFRVGCYSHEKRQLLSSSGASMPDWGAIRQPGHSRLICRQWWGQTSCSGMDCIAWAVHLMARGRSMIWGHLKVCRNSVRQCRPFQ
jgi:hypothetical protein